MLPVISWPSDSGQRQSDFVVVNLPLLQRYICKTFAWTYAWSMVVSSILVPIVPEFRENERDLRHAVTVVHDLCTTSSDISLHSKTRPCCSLRLSRSQNPLVFLWPAIVQGIDLPFIDCSYFFLEKVILISLKIFNVDRSAQFFQILPSCLTPLRPSKSLMIQSRMICGSY